MIGRGFKSVGWVAGVGAAALGCYMLSLRVATERADLARVERQIIATKQQIRSLQTELGTRGRLTQLEQWNEDVLALAAPASGQFLQDEFTLARLDTRDPTVADGAQVRMASLDTAEHESPAKPATPVASAKADPAIAVPGVAAPAVRPELVHRASYTAPPSRGAVASSAPAKPTKALTGQDTLVSNSAKAKSITPARVSATASADSGAARPETAKPVARAATNPKAGGRSVARTELARADAAPTAPARAATARVADLRSTVARTAPERAASTRTPAAGGATGRK